MIIAKSNREIELMKEAGRVTALALRKVKEAIKPGISSLELDKIAENVIREEGCIPAFKGYGDFPCTICASINDIVIHGIPKKNIILKDGDIISIDCGAIYKGYYGDSAITCTVGEVSKEKQRLIDVTEQSFWEGMKFAYPGNHLSDISNAIYQYVKKNGCDVIREYTGHGVGRELHEDPSIPNYGEKGQGPILKKGMTLAVEPMVSLKSPKVKVLSDGWAVQTLDHSATAHFEHTIVITDNGYEILTKEEIQKGEEHVKE